MFLALECTCFWHRSEQVYLFLAKTHKNNLSDGEMIAKENSKKTITTQSTVVVIAACYGPNQQPRRSKPAIFA